MSQTVSCNKWPRRAELLPGFSGSGDGTHKRDYAVGWGRDQFSRTKQAPPKSDVFNMPRQKSRVTALEMFSWYSGTVSDKKNPFVDLQRY